MKRLLVLALLLAATSAFATSGGEGNNTGCNGVGNPNSPCDGSGGGGGTGGGGGGGGGSSTSTNTNTNANTIGNTNQNFNYPTANGGNASNTNTIDNTNRNNNNATANGGNASNSNTIGNTNRNNNNATGGTGVGVGYGGSSDAAAYAGSSASGGNATGGRATGGSANAGVTSSGNASQGQGQEQGQKQTANGGSARVDGSGNGGVSNVSVGGDTIREAAKSAFAAPITVIQSDSCRTGVAAGGQAIAFGLTFSGTQADENCERIKLWRELRQAGYQDEAKELLLQDDRVAKAFATVREHRADSGTGVGKVASVRVPDNVYTGRDLFNEQK